MSKINPQKPKAQSNQAFKGFYLVQREDGQLRCSCGRQLEKLDDYTYRCTGGFPQFRPEDGEVKQDKFGNIYLKMKPHKKDDNQTEAPEHPDEEFEEDYFGDSNSEYDNEELYPIHEHGEENDR